jgi:hypothetical protein
MDERFPNSESSWHADRRVTDVEYSVIASRLGEVDEEVACLSGGLANDNFRIGSDRVLRIYRRDIGALVREQALLSRPWRHLRASSRASRAEGRA